MVWWCWILLTFACLESFGFLHQIWMKVFLSFLGCSLFHFITLNISCHSLLTCRVSVEKSADNLMGVPMYVICHFSLAAFNILSLSLIFVCLVNLCLGVFLLGFMLYGLCTSWTWVAVSYPVLGKFSANISLYFLRPFLCLSSPSGSLIMWMFVWLMFILKVSKTVLISFKSFFLILFHSSDFRHFIFKSLICSSYSFNSVDFF